jgi:hypothetical protein
MSAATQPRAKETSAPASAPRSFKSAPSNGSKPRPLDEAPILFQTFFHSVGTRTYAAQVKKAGNGNHFLVLTEARRDKETDELRKLRLFVFGEDFAEFLAMMQRTRQFIDEHPLPEEFQRKRRKMWEKRNGEGPKAGNEPRSNWKRPNSSPPRESKESKAVPQRNAASRG